MPRKRAIDQASPEDTSNESNRALIPTETENGDRTAEAPGRPKRIRKQTQRYTSAPAASAAAVKTRPPRKASTHSTGKGKGKGKALASPEETPPENAELIGGSTDERPRKKARTEKHSATAPKEKRLAQFRSHCPQNVLERAERVRSQRYDRKLPYCVSET